MKGIGACQTDRGTEGGRTAEKGPIRDLLDLKLHDLEKHGLGKGTHTTRREGVEGDE